MHSNTPTPRNTVVNSHTLYFYLPDFETHYSIPQCASDYNSTVAEIAADVSGNTTVVVDHACERDISLLYLLLLLGTLWLGVTLYNFTKT